MAAPPLAWICPGGPASAEDIDDILKALTDRICHYFSTYKYMFGEDYNVFIEKEYPSEHAFKVVEASVADYLDKFGG